ncbi:unnamed protein product [Lupinus luteus]|uniref:Probable purine permease n=1 Tax=Lupinus luteus TaxID=3873 RepID=A0AAV1WLD5_LUPLU
MEASTLNHQSLINMTSTKNKTSDIESIDQDGGEEAHQDQPNSSMENKMQLHADQKSSTNKIYMPLLVINYIMLFVGSVSSLLLSKYYFKHKGSSKWVSTWVQSAGFPLLTIPIFFPYVLKLTKRKPFTDFNSKILLLSIFVGVMLDSSNERPSGVTEKKYLIGFLCTIGAGLLFASYLPLMEMIFKKVYCYEMVMEMQLIMEISATILATIGMACGGGFSQIKEGQKVFDKGSKIYWVTIVSNIVTWQICFMGTAGMVFLTTSLTGGICMTALLCMNVLGGVVFYRDIFNGFKAVATVLCIWGFCSYVYGMHTKMVEQKAQMVDKNESSKELMHVVNPGATH